MKKTLSSLMLVAVFHIGMNAQWNLSRFDHFNTFTHISLPATNIAYAIGNEPMAGQSFLLKTTDNGITWDSLALNPSIDVFNVYDLQFRTSQHGFISGYQNQHPYLITSQDGGLTWNNITPDVNSVNPLLAVHFVNEELGFAASYNHIYRTDDGGMTWSDTFVDFDFTDISFYNQNVGFYSGYNQLTLEASLMRTTDGGLSWDEVLSDPDPNLFVNQFSTIDIVDANTIYTHLEFTGKLYRSLDGGETWNMFETPIEFTGITDFDFTSASKGHIVNYEGQIWSTQDGGINWTMEYATETGFYGPFVYLYDLAISGSAGFVVGSNGLIKRYTEGLVNSVDNTSTHSFEVYPNPMHHADELTIQLPKELNASSITLLNGYGQVIYSQGINQSGDRLTLPSLNLPSGLYFIQLNSSEGSIEKRLVVIN